MCKELTCTRVQSSNPSLSLELENIKKETVKKNVDDIYTSTCVCVRIVESGQRSNDPGNLLWRL